jgi:hypothetical protein
MRTHVRLSLSLFTHCSFVSPETAPVNVALRSIVEKAFPAELAARKSEASNVITTVTLPLFCLNDPLFPHQVSSIRCFRNLPPHVTP